VAGTLRRAARLKGKVELAGIEKVSGTEKARNAIGLESVARNNGSWHLCLSGYHKCSAKRRFKMGLCLYVLDRDPRPDDEGEPEEIAECDVGHYSDFGCFRDTIARHLGGSTYPTLMNHSDCDGEWSLAEIATLEGELTEIAIRLRSLPPEEPANAFEHTAEYRADAESLYDCFHNVNGENLIEALLDLCQVARKHRRPITFM
jgi:hypothetical protein